MIKAPNRKAIRIFMFLLFKHAKERWMSYGKEMSTTRHTYHLNAVDFPAYVVLYLYYGSFPLPGFSQRYNGASNITLSNCYNY